MSVDLQKVKQVEQSTKDVVFGYIKRSYNDKKIIPELILYICLSYYYQFEIFDKELCSKELKISGLDKNIITKTEGPHSFECNVFGKQWIDSNTNKILKWIIKHISGDKDIGIGIVNNKYNINEEQDPWHNENAFMYYFNGSVHMKRTAMDGCKIQCIEGQTIRFIVDFSKSIIKIETNDDVQNEIIYDNLERGENTKYKLIVSIYTPGNSVEFISNQI